MGICPSPMPEERAFNDCLGRVGHLNRKCKSSLTSLDDRAILCRRRKRSLEVKMKKKKNKIKNPAYVDEWLVRQGL